MIKVRRATGRSLRGNVDRNRRARSVVRYLHSRSLRGNVDRNHFKLNNQNLKTLVVPYVGTWIEIWGNNNGVQDNFIVVPYVGTWIEMCMETNQKKKLKSFPTWERG